MFDNVSRLFTLYGAARSVAFMRMWEEKSKCPSKILYRTTKRDKKRGKKEGKKGGKKERD